jgi:hypothetical protein
MGAMEFPKIVSTLDGAYTEALNLSMGTGMLLSAVRQLAQDLDREHIDYTVIGALALNLHGYSRLTTDIDLLMSEEGLERFRERLVGRGYRLNFEGAKRSFRTTAENIPVEVLTAGAYPGDGLPKAVSFPDPKTGFVIIDGVRTLSLERLVELKLASGMTAPDRLKDLADVQELIKARPLPADFAETLDQSVREKYLELYQAVVHGQARERELEL